MDLDGELTGFAGHLASRGTSSNTQKAYLSDLIMVVPNAKNFGGLQEVLITGFGFELVKSFTKVFGVPIFSIDHITKPNKSIWALISNACKNQITVAIIDLVARSKCDGLGRNKGCCAEKNELQ